MASNLSTALLMLDVGYSYEKYDPRNPCEIPDSQRDLMRVTFLGQNFETEVSLFFSSSDLWFLNFKKKKKNLQKDFSQTLPKTRVDRFQNIYFVK